MKFDYPVGATPLDPNELNGLIPRHIVLQSELNAWEEKNILEAQPWAFRQKEILSIAFMQKLHKHMFNKTWKWAGKFRTSEKNIGVHWPQIPTKLHDLLEDIVYQCTHTTFSDDEIAVRFHHRLVSIHPFSNGNGRHARLMADLLVTHRGGGRFSWGMHQDPDQATGVRLQYIEALQRADRGNYSTLLIFARS